MSRHGSNVIPALRYRDANAAIAWLVEVFGFWRQAVHPDDAGGVAHAQLVLGDGMVMVSSVRETPHGALMRQPDEIGGFETQTSYLVVGDIDAVHRRAVDHGAEIVRPLQDESYGGRGFTCRDLEGRVWAVGSYNPWA